MEDYFRSIGMPTSLHELGIAPSEEQILELADKCSFGNTRTIGKVRELNREQIAEIYRLAQGINCLHKRHPAKHNPQTAF
mgnify:CR=1 FL=1